MTFFDTNGSFRIVIQCHYHLLIGKILYNRSFWLNRYLKVGDASLLTGSRWNPKSSINKGVRKFTLPCQLKFGFLENLRFWVCTFEYCCSALQVICNRNCYAAEKNFRISKLAKKNVLFWKSAIFGQKFGHFWRKIRWNNLLCDLLVRILHFPPLWRSAVLLIAS